jgi:CBS domain-containing membrane protein
LGVARDLEGDSFEVALRSAGAFVAIALIGLAESLRVPGLDATFLIGSLGASAVIVFGAPDSPMARTRAVFGGHFVSGVIGVICFKLFGDVPWLSGALAVSVSIFAMHLTRTMHAPGGATALIANIGSEKVKALGFAYVLSPVLTGALVLMIVALMVRSLRARRAPEALVFESDEDDALADEFERD